MKLAWLLAARMADHDGQVWAGMWAPEQLTYVEDAERFLQDLAELVPKLPAAERAELLQQWGLA